MAWEGLTKGSRTQTPYFKAVFGVFRAFRGECVSREMTVYTTPYIPRADAAFRAWAESFVNTIVLAPSQFMMTAGETQELKRRLDDFVQAFAIASNEATRTKGTIAAKDDARSILENTCRIQASFIKINRGIPDGAKLGIGVPPINIGRGKRKCPISQPLLNYIGSLPGIDQLVFHDSNTPNSVMKPYGAERLELWRAYSILAGPNAEPMPKKEDAKLVGSFKKSKMLIETDLEQEAMGRRPTYWGRWVGFHGDVGPWSLALNTTIAARQARAAKKKAASDAEVKPEAQPSDAAMKIAA